MVLPHGFADLARLPQAEADEAEEGGLCQGTSWDWACQVPELLPASGCESCTSVAAREEILVQEILKAEGRKTMSFISLPLLTVDVMCKEFVAQMGLCAPVLARAIRQDPHPGSH